MLRDTIGANRDLSSNIYRLVHDYAAKKKDDIEANMRENAEHIYDKMDQINKDFRNALIGINNIQKTLDQMNSKCTMIKENIEANFLDGTVKELRLIKSEIDDVNEGIKQLITDSYNVDKENGKDGENIRKISQKMLDLIANGDREAIEFFENKIIEKSDIISKAIDDNQNASPEQKEEAKSCLNGFKSIKRTLEKKFGDCRIGQLFTTIPVNQNLRVVGDAAAEFGGDVKDHIFVGITTGIILRLLLPIVSTLLIGIPIPSPVVDIFLEAMRGVANI
jgi:gas vesicle protein